MWVLCAGTRIVWQFRTLSSELIQHRVGPKSFVVVWRTQQDFRIAMPGFQAGVVPSGNVEEGACFLN